MACVYFVVFTQILDARDAGYDPYFLYLLTGLLAWQWFSQCMTETSRALLSEARLVRSTNRPRELWVVGGVPQRVTTGPGLSAPVRAAVPVAVDAVLRLLRERGCAAARRTPPRAADVWWERLAEASASPSA